jgi:hypothetical protein
MLPEHISFGRNYVAIMSPINCATTTPTTSLVDAFQNASAPYKWVAGNTNELVTVPSIRYFLLGTLA